MNRGGEKDYYFYLGVCRYTAEFQKKESGGRRGFYEGQNALY